VKKSLKALDKPDPNQTPEEQVSNTRRCLVKIGRHIDSILEPMSEDKARDWRSHLWYFVSNFTEFDAKKLFKLYRHAVKKSLVDEEEKESSQEKEDKKEKREKDKHHKKKHGHKEKERLRDREDRKSQDSDTPKTSQEGSHLPVKKERIAPPRLPDMDRESSYRASLELAEKSGAGSHSQHNGERRDNYRGEPAGYDKGGYNQQYKNHSHGYGGRGGYRNEVYRGRGYGGGSGYRERFNDRNWDAHHHRGGRWSGGGGGYRGRDGHWRDRPERIAPPPPDRGYYTEGSRDSYDSSRDGYERSRDGYNTGEHEDHKDLNDSREEGEIGAEEEDGAYVRDANDTT